MDDLAEELGISKKTLYAHFPGKFAPALRKVLKTFVHLEPKTDLARASEDLLNLV